MKIPARWARPACSAVMILLVAAFSVLVAGCSGSGDDASDGFKTYSNGQYRYSFQYPGSWKLQEGVSADVSAGGSAAANVGVYDPDGAVAEDTYIDMAQISVYELNTTVDESMMAEIKGEVEGVLASLESQAGDLQTVEALTETTVNGMSGFKVTYSFAKNGAPVQSTLYFLFSGDLEYQVTVQAAQDHWEAKKPVFDGIIASLKPTT